MYSCKEKINLMHNLFVVYFVNLYMFLAYLGPSSGGATVCVQHLVNIVRFRWLSLFLDGLEFHPEEQTKYTMNKLCIKFLFLYTILSFCFKYISVWWIGLLNLTPANKFGPYVMWYPYSVYVFCRRFILETNWTLRCLEAQHSKWSVWNSMYCN